MGDGPSLGARDNRGVRIVRLGEERKVLEWKPRLITVLLVLALFAVAFAAGYFEFIVDNWEW
jgi:hypothetical protein